MNKTEFGKIGESITCKYLCQNHYKIIDKNYYYKGGEIDIIAKDKNEYVFVEVKTRTNNKFGKPVEAVNKTKKRHIYKTAEYYLYYKKIQNVYVRFDIIEILKKQNRFYVHHIKNAIIYWKVKKLLKIHKKITKNIAKPPNVWYTIKVLNKKANRGVAQLVARVVWDHEVAGSIPVTSTIF